jgi:hypothetical protein
MPGSGEEASVGEEVSTLYHLLTSLKIPILPLTDSARLNACLDSIIR